MPQATDLTLKDAAGTDKTFSLACPAGPGGSAVWLLREGANASVFPKIECSSSTTAGRNGRKVKLSFSFPAPTVNAAGVTVPAGKMSFNFDVTVPDSIPDDLRDDAIAIIKDLLSTSLVASVFKTGYAPT